MNDTNYDFFCGIDISKKTLDFTFINKEETKLFFLQTSNDKKGIKKYTIFFSDIMNHDTLKFFAEEVMPEFRD